MRFLCVSLVLFFLGVGSATADIGLLNRIASVFAMNEVSIECAEPPLDAPTAYGWVYKKDKEHIFVNESLCPSLFLIPSFTDPEEAALGILVVIHESYHQRRQWNGYWDESLVECKAIRHFVVGAQLLGLSKEASLSLLPFALELHWSLPFIYHTKPCKVPMVK